MRIPPVRSALSFLTLTLLGVASCANVDKGVGPANGGGGSSGGGTGGTAGTSVDGARTDLPGVGGPRDATGPVEAGPPCENLCKQQMTCPGGGDTTISGVVHAPTPPKFGAADPLYNVLVYVPNAPVSKFTPGVACQKCEAASGSPLIKAVTGSDGKFTLKNAPVGNNIPLVVQIGRWRRQVVIPSVAACANTALPDELTRLPRNKSEGDIPAIAIATGTWDPFDCTLRKIGIDESEFTLGTGNGRVNLWAYGGHTLAGAARTPPGDDLMGSRPTLSKYDLLLLPCDDNEMKEQIVEDNLIDYTSHGGRVFLTDWGYSWLRSSPIFEGTVTWKPDLVTEGEDFTTLVDTTFPKGMALSAWMSVVGAAAPAAGQLPVHDPYGGSSYVDAVVPPTQRWLYTQDPEKTIQHLTFNTPVGMPDDQKCGRVVYSQFHVAEEEGIDFPPTSGDSTFPAACNNKPMTPQEKALEFMLFDLSSCVQADTEPPLIP